MEIRKRHGGNICKPIFIVLLFQLAILSGVSAAADISGELSIGISQRNDNLNWSIAGSTVNVLSELKWESMSISQLQAAGEIHLKNDRWVRARLGYGVINSGTNQDSDYNGNNRTLEYSRSNNRAGGDVLDAGIALGKKLLLRDLHVGNSFYLTPFAGFSIHRQNLTMADGIQTIPAMGPFPGLDSSYDAQWLGPWLGAEALIETAHGWFVKANVEYHLVDYSANANWNLRPDLAHPVSFRHIATGDGIVMSLGAAYPVDKNWKMEFTLERHNWSTHAGSDQVFLANGTSVYVQLNAVNWDSTAYRLGVARQF